MTMDTSFDDALRALQSGRSMSMDELQQLPVTWFEVVKMSGNRAQRALLGRTRPRLVGLHVPSGQLVVLKLDAIRCAWLKWTRKVQDVQQLYQLRRRMGDATLTQLTLQFFPQGGAQHFSDIFLFQEAAARKFVKQVSSFRVSSKADDDSTAYHFSPQLQNSRSDSAAELDTSSNHSNPLYTPDRSSPPPADSQMDYKARFHARLQAKRAAAAAATAGSTALADTAVQPAAAANSMNLLMDDEFLIESATAATPCTPPSLSAPPPQQPPPSTAPPAAAAEMQVEDEFAFLFQANAQQPAAAASSFYTPPSYTAPSMSYAPAAVAAPASTNPFATHATAPTAATWTTQMDPFNSVGLQQRS